MDDDDTPSSPLQAPGSRDSASRCSTQPKAPWYFRNSAEQQRRKALPGTESSHAPRHCHGKKGCKNSNPQAEEQPEICPALHESHHAAAAAKERQHARDAQMLGLALGSGSSPEALPPITFGPALQQYIQQVAATLEHRTDILHEVLELVHQYQAQGIAPDALQRQMSQLLRKYPQLLHDFQQFMPHPPATNCQQPYQSQKEVEGDRPKADNTGKRSARAGIRRKSSSKYMLVMRNLDKRQYKNLQRRFRRKGMKVNNWEHLMSWLSPAQRGAHTPWWTFIFTTSILVIFFFMAGGYGLYLAQQGGCLSVSTASGVTSQYGEIRSRALAPAPSPTSLRTDSSVNIIQGSAANATAQDFSATLGLAGNGCEEAREWVQAGPGSMRGWAAWQADWRQFDFDYLLAWGGLYEPALLQGQWWRWITWVFVHTGFQHVTANLLMWLALALPLEYAYGSARILAVWLISALGSALFAAAFQAQCTLVVGCSGAVFGFMGLYVADMLLNFRSLSFPWLRLIWIAATLAYFVVASITQGSFVSYWAHVGGFVCGLFPSFFFLPNLKDKRWMAASNLARRMGLLPDPSRKKAAPTGASSNTRSGTKTHARRLSSCLPRRRHSESLMTSYLQMQADALGKSNSTKTGSGHAASLTQARRDTDDLTYHTSQRQSRSRQALNAQSVHRDKPISKRRACALQGMKNRCMRPFTRLSRPGEPGKHPNVQKHKHVMPSKCPRQQCCGVPVHVVIALSMGLGLVAVLGVFLALPLYVYLGRLPHMQC